MPYTPITLHGDRSGKQFIQQQASKVSCLACFSHGSFRQCKSHPSTLLQGVWSFFWGYFCVVERRWLRWNVIEMKLRKSGYRPSLNGWFGEPLLSSWRGCWLFGGCCCRSSDHKSEMNARNSGEQWAESMNGLSIRLKFWNWYDEGSHNVGLY